MTPDKQQMDEIDWLIANYGELERNYAGKWVAVLGTKIVASSVDISDLLQQVREARVDGPLITQIASVPVVWRTAYVSQGVRREHTLPSIPYISLN